MKYFIILFILQIYWSSVSFGQEFPLGKPKVSTVIFPGYEKWGHPTSIQFYDTISGQLIRNYNFAENNPYKLPYKLINTSKDSTRWEFEIEDRATIDTSYLFSSNYLICTYSDRTPKFIEVNVSLVDLQGNFVLVSYQLIAKNKFKQGIGGRTTIFIMDKKGQDLFQFRHLPYDANGIAINSTGKYLMTSFSGPIGCDNYKSIRQGIVIYNVEDSQKAYENNSFYGASPAQLSDGLLGICANLDNGGVKYLYFSPEEKKIYSKEFLASERKCIKKITQNAFILQCRENEQELTLKFKSLPSINF